MTPAATQQQESPQPHRFTRDDYYQMDELGMFVNRRVERILGEIIDMAPQNNPHYLCVNLVAAALHKAFGKGHWVRSQGPLSLAEHSDPEPDVAVVRGEMRDFKAHPTTAILLVEVSDSTLRFDRKIKAALYAQQGIADYWVININRSSVEIRRNPVRDADSPTGWNYASVQVHKAAGTISPLAMPAARILVADLLP